LAQKKVWDRPVAERQQWVELHQSIALNKQCALLNINRSVIYQQQKQQRNQCKFDGRDQLLLQLIDEEYTRHPFFGSRKIRIYLRDLGHRVNRKCVQRLMRILGLAGMAPGPNTSKAHPQHKVYPYLLRGLDIVRPNQVWSTDVTYIRLPRGFVYLVAIIDWYSRKVLSWRLSNSMDASFCVDCLQEALAHFGKPDIFNSDQGSQFTSDAFTGVLKKNGITISMDGRGRALDNIFVERLWRTVKYEEIYLKKYDNLPSLLLGLTEYFVFYNEVRPHQSLCYKTPSIVYQNAAGGGAKIVDKFGERDKQSAGGNLGQRQSAAVIAETLLN
jgi:putative transposase